jgi:hypothetical protein
MEKPQKRTDCPSKGHRNIFDWVSTSLVRVLAVGAHPGDVELGLGGTIAALSFLGVKKIK